MLIINLLSRTGPFYPLFRPSNLNLQIYAKKLFASKKNLGNFHLNLSSILKSTNFQYVGFNTQQVLNCFVISRDFCIFAIENQTNNPINLSNDKVTEIFYFTDNFCKEFYKTLDRYAVEDGEKPIREFLRNSRDVRSFRAERLELGGEGITIVTII